MARTINYDVNVDAGDATRTLGQIEDDLAQINLELREVDVTSTSFQTLTQRSQSLESELRGVNTQIEGFTSERRQQALQGSIDIFAGGIEIISGLSAAFGVQDERLERVLVQLVAVSQAANGIRTVTAGFIALTTATNGATAAATRFNTVSRRNIILLVASLAAAGVAYLVLSDDADGASNSIIRGLEDQLDAFRGTRREQILLERQLLMARVPLLQNDTQRRDVQRQINRLTGEYNNIIADNVELSRRLTRINQDDEFVDRQRRAIEINQARGVSEQVILAEIINNSQVLLDRRQEEVDALIAQNASEADIQEARMRRDQAKDDLDEALHQGTLNRIRTERQVEQQLLDQQIDNVADLGNLLSIAAGDSKGLAIAGLIVENAAGVARVVINTRLASARALAELGPVVGAPVATAVEIGGAISVASIIASTAVGIQQINDAPGPPASGGVTSFGRQAGPTVSTPAFGVDAVQAPGGQALGVNQGGAPAQQTVVAVVAQGDITNEGERNARTRNKRRLNRRP